jgi:hypothetical protein
MITVKNTIMKIEVHPSVIAKELKTFTLLANPAINRPIPTNVDDKKGTITYLKDSSFEPNSPFLTKNAVIKNTIPKIRQMLADTTWSTSIMT